MTHRISLSRLVFVAIPCAMIYLVCSFMVSDNQDRHSTLISWFPNTFRSSIASNLRGESDHALKKMTTPSFEPEVTEIQNNYQLKLHPYCHVISPRASPINTTYTTSTQALWNHQRYEEIIRMISPPDSLIPYLIRVRMAHKSGHKIHRDSRSFDAKTRHDDNINFNIVVVDVSLESIVFFRNQLELNRQTGVDMPFLAMAYDNYTCSMLIRRNIDIPCYYDEEWISALTNAWGIITNQVHIKLLSPYFYV